MKEQVAQEFVTLKMTMDAIVIAINSEGLDEMQLNDLKIVLDCVWKKISFTINENIFDWVKN